MKYINGQRVGLTLGKFLPFHRGHELLIRTAHDICPLLVVLVGVSPDDKYSFEQRKAWILSCINPSADNQVLVIKQAELDKNAPKDKDGTITDESYWERWTSDTRSILDRIDVTSRLGFVFTSDKYGERIATELGVMWVPIDPGREFIPTSGTAVRSDLYKEWKNLPKPTRRDLVKTVAVLGPESVGKSTAISRMRDKYTIIPEYGRILSEAKKNELKAREFMLIQIIQQSFIKQAKFEAEYPVIVSDTEALITALYSDLYLDKEELEQHRKRFFDAAENQMRSGLIDRYILLSPVVPWVQDGYRMQDTTIKRWTFFYDIRDHLMKCGVDYKIVADTDFDIRQTKIERYISELLV